MKKLQSVLTDDMDHCYFTGCNRIERHHIFGGSNRNRSEKYGFVVPLRPDLHPNGAHVQWDAKMKAIDISLKQLAQFYFEQYYGSRQDFIREFGKSYLLSEENPNEV